MTNNSKKPNIVLILIDDLGYRDLSCYGSTFYETPNLDKLASESVMYTDGYSTCPVCSPTRASIMSGKYPARVGITDWISHTDYHPLKGKLIDAPYLKHLPLTEKSLATSLKEGGYKTWHVGKWHLGEQQHYPDKHGFDVNIAGCHLGGPHNGYYSPYNIPNLENGPDGEYLTDRLTDEAIKLIKESDDTPFFLNLWHYAVHIHIEADKKLTEKYEKKKKLLGLDNCKEFNDSTFFPFDLQKHMRINKRIVQSDCEYAAMIENLDDNIGRLLAEIKAKGIEDNTIIIFTSDNGGESSAGSSPTCNSPLCEGKGWMYDGGVRVPLLIKWGNNFKPKVSNTVVNSNDFYPTLLECAGLPLNEKQHIDGVSILKDLTGEGQIEREAIFWHYPHYGNQGGTPGCSVRMGDYKLIEFFEDGRMELYNLKDDIGENNNLVKEMPELVEKMKKLLDNFKEDVSAKIPQKNPEYL